MTSVYNSSFAVAWFASWFADNARAQGAASDMVTSDYPSQISNREAFEDLGNALLKSGENSFETAALLYTRDAQVFTRASRGLDVLNLGLAYGEMRFPE